MAKRKQRNPLWDRSRFCSPGMSSVIFVTPETSNKLSEPNAKAYVAANSIQIGYTKEGNLDEMVGKICAVHLAVIAIVQML